MVVLSEQYSSEPGSSTSQGLGAMQVRTWEQCR
jgi:hypothetical protein